MMTQLQINSSHVLVNNSILVYFQKELGCPMVSFNIREIVTQQSGNVYTCFLDTTKTFDTVWRPGLNIMKL